MIDIETLYYDGRATVFCSKGHHDKAAFAKAISFETDIPIENIDGKHIFHLYARKVWCCDDSGERYMATIRSQKNRGAFPVTVYNPERDF